MLPKHADLMAPSANQTCMQKGRVQNKIEISYLLEQTVYFMSRWNIDLFSDEYWQSG